MNEVRLAQFRLLLKNYGIPIVAVLILLEATFWILRGDDGVVFKSIEVLRHFDDVFDQGPLLSFWTTAGTSVLRTIVVIFLSTLIGCILGIVCAMSRFAQRCICPYLDFVRSIPITFLIPVVFSIKGLSISWIAPVVLATIPCALIVCASVVERSLTIDPDRLHTAKILLGRNDGWRRLYHFYFWEVLSGITTGLRVSIPYASILIGVLEFVNFGPIPPGFGYLVAKIGETTVMEARLSYTLIAAVCMYGAFGLTLLKLSGGIANKVSAWDRSVDQE